MRPIDADTLKEEVDMAWRPDMAVSEIWNVIDEAPTIGGQVNMKAQESIEPILALNDGEHELWQCGNCKVAIFTRGTKYCHNCGMAVKWE